MKIDFSWSLEDWKKVFGNLILLVSNMFAALGIKLFPDSPDFQPWDEILPPYTKPGSEKE